MASERPYTEEDLVHLTKKKLIKLVNQQQHLWPTKNFNTSKITVGVLRENLLQLGFTKEGSCEEDIDLLALSTGGESRDALAGGGSQGDGPSAQPATKPHFLSESALARKHDLTSALDTLNATAIGPQAPQALETRRIQLLIDDNQGMAHTEKNGLSRTTELIDLSPVLVHSNGDWDFQVKDMLCKLRRSNAAIDGVVKLAYPDPVEPAYNHIFLKMTQDDVLLEDVPSNPEILSIPSTSSSLRIVVDHAKNMHSHMPGLSFPVPLDVRERFPATDSTAGDRQEYPLVKARQRRDDVEERHAEWLKSKALARPGYGMFQANQNRKLKNSDRVEFWAFAASFSADLFKAHSPISRTRKVTKKDILRALGIGMTALSEAENAARIVRVFGRGGTQAAEEVVEMLDRDEVLGSGVLYAFLVEWERDYQATSLLNT